jgi:hypothetical protein
MFDLRPIGLALLALGLASGCGTADDADANHPPPSTDASTDVASPVPRFPPVTLTATTTTIVVPKSPLPGETAAANLLQETLRSRLEATTGFAIVTEGTPIPDGDFVFAIGRTKLEPETTATLDRDGFALVRRDRSLAIAGGRVEAAAYDTLPGRGTLLGVVEVLDRFAGVRFYLPGELFTIGPRAGAPVVVGDAEEVDSPFAKSLLATGLPANATAWAQRNGLDNRRRGGAHQHTMAQMFDPKLHRAAYPEVFPANMPADGSGAWHPCFAQPRAVDVAMDAIRRYFETNPTHAYVALSVMDNSAKCPTDPVDAQAYTDAYWGFMNAVAKKMATQYPGKRLMGLAYANVQLAPTFDLEKNVVVFAVVHLSELDADGILSLDPNGGIRPWMRRATILGEHEWLEGMGFLLPRIYTGHIQRYLLATAEAAHPAEYLHLEAYPNWALDGPKLYLAGKLAQNPHADVAHLRARFCADAFGDGAEAMEAYFVGLESLWYDLDEATGPERKLFRWSNQFVTTAGQFQRIVALRALLDAAAAKTTGIEARRVAFFSNGFRLSEYLFRLAASPAPNVALAAEAKAFFETTLAKDPLALYDRTGGAGKHDAIVAIESLTKM